MSDCVFCSIAAGETPSYKVYEDENYMAMLDLAQITDGHTLVIPKQHYRWVWDVEDIGGYFSVVRKVARRMQEMSGQDMVVSATFGEMVEHAHVHLLPKTEGSLQLVMDAWNEALQSRKVDLDRLRVLADTYRLNKS